MPDCDYCDQSFPDEGPLLEHMGEAHEGELGRIDQRRVEEHYGGDDGGFSTTVTYAVVGIVFVAIVGGAVYAAVGAFSGGPSEQIHEHGTINMTIDGERFLFNEPQHTESGGFHFHDDPSEWHMHPREPGRLTLATAMEDVGIELTADSITVNGTTYSDSDSGTNLSIRINGEPVDPEEYELQGSGPNPQEGDHIQIVVDTEN